MRFACELCGERCCVVETAAITDPACVREGTCLIYPHDRGAWTVVP